MNGRAATINKFVDLLKTRFQDQVVFRSWPRNEWLNHHVGVDAILGWSDPRFHVGDEPQTVTFNYCPDILVSTTQHLPDEAFETYYWSVFQTMVAAPMVWFMRNMESSRGLRDEAINMAVYNTDARFPIRQTLEAVADEQGVNLYADG